VSSLSQRTGSVAARQPDRPRDLQEVTLVLLDGTQVHGVLHRAHGTRTLDYLNRQAEGFVAMTDAELVRDGRSELVAFIAINKSHIVRLTEAVDGH
jgi:hypothetical protein